ncbi:MAG: sigma-70 family RNA polymerase sigma factor [Oscillospiraceae bacterium]|nr:sigma-70 family RNA polymerase sigma factor [Oscillospiraceae bacterium]
MEKQEYKELQATCVNGGMKAFARLYETVYREMYYSAYYSLADDADAVEVVTNAVRSTFNNIARLHTENAFLTFIMKTLCTCIKMKFKEYAGEGREIRYDKTKLRPNDDGIDVKQEFNRLPDTERLIAALYVGGRFRPDEIAHFTGLSASTVRKKLEKAMEGFALD